MMMVPTLLQAGTLYLVRERAFSCDLFLSALLLSHAWWCLPSFLSFLLLLPPCLM